MIDFKALEKDKLWWKIVMDLVMNPRVKSLGFCEDGYPYVRELKWVGIERRKT
jgi:hypothetical protein